MITIDLELYYVCAGAVLVALGGMWGFRRIKSLFAAR